MIVSVFHVRCHRGRGEPTMFLYLNFGSLELNTHIILFGSFFLFRYRREQRANESANDTMNGSIIRKKRYCMISVVCYPLLPVGEVFRTSIIHIVYFFLCPCQIFFAYFVLNICKMNTYIVLFVGFNNA